MKGQVVQRLFADDYSSTGQVAWRNGQRGTGAEWWREDYMGQLRFDSLLVPTLVIPDSHVFDGPFFLGTTPRRLRSQLGPAGQDQEAGVPPLEIRGRARSLSASLAALLRRPGRETLNAFVFKSIDDPVLRPELAAELGRTKATELDRELARADDDSAVAVASLLHECVRRVDPAANVDALIDPLEEGWRAWLAEEHDSLNIEAWPTFGDFDVASGLGAEPLESRDLVTAVGREALAQVRALVDRGSEHRSDVSQLLVPLREAASETGDEHGLADLELVDVWYSRGRYRALAVRHGCGCVMEDRPWLPALSAGQAVLREVLGRDGNDRPHVPVPDDVLSRLGDLPGEEFQALKHRHRRRLRSWWNGSSIKNLDEVAEELAGLTSTSSRPALGIAQFLPPVVGGAAGLVVGKVVGDAALGGLVGTLVGTSGQAALARRPNEAERVRIRVLEALGDRARAQIPRGQETAELS